MEGCGVNGVDLPTSDRTAGDHLVILCKPSLQGVLAHFRSPFKNADRRTWVFIGDFRCCLWVATPNSGSLTRTCGYLASAKSMFVCQRSRTIVALGSDIGTPERNRTSISRLRVCNSAFELQEYFILTSSTGFALPLSKCSGILALPSRTSHDVHRLR